MGRGSREGWPGSFRGVEHGGTNILNTTDNGLNIENETGVGRVR